jgi:hypothetical protein
MGGMILLMLVVGGLLGWIGRSARIQREAVAAIKDAGGTVVYSWERNTRVGTSAGKLWGPNWLVDLIGVDYFGHLDSVGFVRCSRASDSVLAQVSRLTGLQVLQFRTCPVSDTGVAHLKGLGGLFYLDLSGTQITNGGLAHLKGMTNLSGLFLSDTHISDAGLMHIEGLENLRILSLQNTQVSDVGLARLKGLTRFKTLYLDNSQVAGAAVPELERALPNLKIRAIP